jgi:uncharacterized repeat protein (TIGR03803 family)
MKTTTPSRLFAAAIFFAAILLSGTSLAQYTQTILHTFPTSKDGISITRNPVFADPSGILYGTSFGGGAHGVGSFFSLTLTPGNIWREAQLFSFPDTNNSTSSPNPSGAIVRDAAGNFFGLSPFDGLGNCNSQGYLIGCGIVWRISHTSLGWQRSIIYAFTGGADEGGPASLIIDSAGNLYGVTNTVQWGTVFELSPSGATWSFKTLYTFTGGADGGAPNAVVLDHSGNLLGSTYAGGIVNQNVCYDYNTNNYGCGVVFELSPSGGTFTESTLYSFLGGNDGGQPFGTLALDPSGNLFGIAVDAGANSAGVVFQVSKTSDSWTETVPYAFTNPASPSPGVSSDAAGNIYGGTQFGGLLNTCENGCGTLFQLSPVSGGYAYNTLYSFSDAFDGESPYQPPTIDSQGNLFVPTNSTFASNYGNQSLSIEFELSPGGAGKWRSSVVHDFPSSPDGFNPVGSLVRDSAGNLYGTTPAGGAYGWGTIFQVTPSGSASATKTLYSFHGTSDGALPSAGLALDSAGNLYGIARFGGSSKCLAGCGTVFKLSPASGGPWNFSVLHTFKNAQDGSSPTAGVILDGAGNLYGTSQGGTNTSNCGGRGCGIVFKLTPTSLGEWTPTLIYAFSGSIHTGGIPAYGTIVMDPSGNLYGVTEAGGTASYGVVYKLSPQPIGPWKETLLYNVASTEAYSQGTLVLDHAGNLYGTTEGGGTYGYGTVFELSPSGGGLFTKTTLFSFNGGSTGGNLHGGVVFDSAGTLFGVSSTIAFELSLVAGAWQETTLFTFNNLTETPGITLAIDPAGNLYGVIPNENTTVQNVVYELTP